MPQKATLEDGTEIEVPTEEEKKTAEDAAAKKEKDNSDELEKLQTLNKELEEGTDVNWPEVRKKIKDGESLAKALKESGYTVGEDGKIVDDPSKNVPTPEESKKTTEEIVDSRLVKSHVDTKLSGYDEDTKKVIQSQYDLLSAGQELDIAKADAILNNAIKIGAPDAPPPDPTRSGGNHGGPPVLHKDSEVTETTKEMGASLGIKTDDYNKSGDVSGLLLNNEK